MVKDIQTAQTILSIETSTSVCSVAVHQDKRLIAKQSVHKGQSHSTILNSMIRQVLSHSGIDMKKLTAIAIAKGPGSYTGLRIGTSTAKGLCYALNLPLLAVNTLEAMAHGVKKHIKGLLCPMLDARRMEVYAAIYHENNDIVMPTSPIILDENSFHDLLNKNNIYFFGEGSYKFKNITNHPNAHFIASVVPDAEFIGALASIKLAKKEVEDIAYFEPFYLKDFMATKPKPSF